MQVSKETIERVAEAIYQLQPESYTTGHGATGTRGYSVSFNDAGRESYDNCVAKAQSAITAYNESPEVRELIEAASMAKLALERCYNVVDWPADGTTSQDEAIKLLETALSPFTKAGKKV